MCKTCSHSKRVLWSRKPYKFHFFFVFLKCGSNHSNTENKQPKFMCLQRHTTYDCNVCGCFFCLHAQFMLAPSVAVHNTQTRHRKFKTHTHTQTNHSNYAFQFKKKGFIFIFKFQNLLLATND